MIYCSDEILAEEISQGRNLIYYTRMKPKLVFAGNKLRNKMTQDHVLKEYNSVVLGTGKGGRD